MAKYTPTNPIPDDEVDDDILEYQISGNEWLHKKVIKYFAGDPYLGQVSAMWLLRGSFLLSLDKN